jgi:hypothetical protein
LLLAGLKFHQSSLGKQRSAVAKSDSLHDRHKSCLSLSFLFTLRSLGSAAQRKSGRQQTHRAAAGRRADLRETMSFLHSRRFFFLRPPHYNMHAAAFLRTHHLVRNALSGRKLHRIKTRVVICGWFSFDSRTPHLCRAQYFCWQLPNNYQLNGESGERKWIIGLAAGN